VVKRKGSVGRLRELELDTGPLQILLPLAEEYGPPPHLWNSVVSSMEHPHSRDVAGLVKSVECFCQRRAALMAGKIRYVLDEDDAGFEEVGELDKPLE
jgi:hypothetical protein